MDDNALAQSCVLFFVGCDHGQCPKCSNPLPKKPKLDSLQSQCLMANALINNAHLCTGMAPQKPPKCCSIKHVLTMVPPYKKFQGRLTNCKTKYGKWKCMDCAHIVRSYCLCTPGMMYCTGCYGNHHADVAGDKKGLT